MVCVDNSCKKEKWTIAWNPGEVYFVWQLQCELLFKADALQDLFWNIPQTLLSKEIRFSLLLSFSLPFRLVMSCSMCMHLLWLQVDY